MSDCDVICNVDFNDIIAYHQKTNADMTIAVKTVELTPATAKINTIFTSDEEGRVTDVLAYPTNFKGTADISLNIVVMKTSYLKQIVLDAIAHDHNSLTRDVIARNMNRMNYRVYKYEGYFACISSFEEYYRNSMDLLRNSEARASLFSVKNRPVYTKVRNSSPSYYSPTSSVKNSMIADGCYIEGTVENSIIFRGVKIGRNATVKNSIIMQDSIIGEGASLDCVITDKNAVITDKRRLSGADIQPYYISKGKKI
jgi:glucose-1-phosphate adenylyltransferase